jgi:DNA-binding GntR family transcriptional regulator
MTMGPASEEGTAGVARLSDQVHDLLRDAIMNGRVPVTERLTEAKLARQLGISRTPVREALGWLAAAGLLRREDYGFAVQVPSVDGMRQLYELRITLELRGIARAIDDPSIRHDHTLLAQELASWYQMRILTPAATPDFVVLDERFHVALLRSSGNEALVEALEAVNARIRHVRMYDFLVNTRIEVSIDEHIQITELVLAGELAQAHEALHAHIGASSAIVMERVSKAIAAMSTDRPVALNLGTLLQPGAAGGEPLRA